MSDTDLLKKHFGFSNFRTGQADIIDAILANKDVLAVLPTGAGKSLCYQYPALALQKLVIVVSPLIALMKDQVSALTRRGIPAGCLHSGQSREEKLWVFRQMQAEGPFLLYLSPERVQKEGFQKWILDQKIGLFAIDEAHCVSQWGHDFREEYAELKILRQLRPEVPILALTASATPAVLDDISQQLKLQKPERKIHGFYRPNLYFQVEACEDDSKKFEILCQAIRQNPTGRVIVYCGTRRITEELSQSLAEVFDSVGYYHAGLPTADRSLVQQSYDQGEIRILVATNAFGMGVDQADVRLVVHFQMPGNLDSLYQEMGRAGRDGLPATCLMIYAKKDKGLQSYFIQSSKAAVAIKSARWRALEAIVSYSESSECRHGEILTYYRDSQRIRSCGHCDSCSPTSDRKIQINLPTPAGKKTKLRKSAAAEFQLSVDQEARYQVLKKWRKAKATELDTPAFTIFSDKTLRHIATANPQTKDQLRNIHGIGDVKLERFGWDLLNEIGSS